MLDSSGWFDWAERIPGNLAKTNTGINLVRGIFLHSAEGYEPYLRSHPAQPTGVSWHLSNLFDGRLLQHYPVTARCWHATAANNAYIGMEHEGVYTLHPTLTDAQIVTARRVIKEVSNTYGWIPRRPVDSVDLSYTLWEHREVIKLGGSASSCPNGRIPWDKILQLEQKEQLMIRRNGVANPGFWNGLPINGDQWFNVRGDFDLPDATRVRLDIVLRSGYLDVLDGDQQFAGRVGGEAALREQIDVILNADGYALVRGTCQIELIGITGYWNQ